MPSNKDSVHEKIVTAVVAAVMIGIFLKVLFF
jgi:hypothetical protein